MPDDGYRTLFRIVLTDPPTVQDMLSHQALGKIPPQPGPETQRLVTGISVYNTEQQARRKAFGIPWRGNAFIAELRLPENGSIRIERTLKSPGLHTIWGNPHDILDSVSRVSGVDVEQ